jgi:hypothetical protein
MRNRSSFMKDREQGAVLIIVAVAMVALLLLVALSVDLGGLYKHDRDLQTAADAGALAGAQELIYKADNSALDPAAMATTYVEKNLWPFSQVKPANLVPWAPAVDSKSVTVDLREDHVLFSFARVAGRDEGSVKAHAKAEVKYLTGVNTLFPVALLIMNPDHFHFIIKNGSTEVASFDLRDANQDGIYDQGGMTFTPPAAGLYSVTLQAMTSKNEVGLELPDIGYWRAADANDPNEYILKVGMAQSLGSGTVTVSVLTKGTISQISAKLGNSNVGLTDQGGGLYRGTVQAPVTDKAKDGYATYDLAVTVKAGQGKPNTYTVAKYLGFNADVPLIQLTMTPSEWGGYSGVVGQSTTVGAVIKTRTYNFGDSFVMKLGNQAGSGLYSGNWRVADIYAGVNTRDEVGTVNPPDSWKLNYPLYIGGPLLPEPGAKVGQVIQGLDDRTDSNTAPQNDPRRVVIVPLVDWNTNLHGASTDYLIREFCAFRITNYHDKGSDKGDCEGVFLHWVLPGTWQDNPPGPLYVQTAVLTE